jgi:hypothetical protein
MYDNQSLALTVYSMTSSLSTKVTYHPNGYPHLGLVPRTINIRYRKGMSTRTLKARLEKWERDNGNPKFEARALLRLSAPLAYELVQVYIAMRERYPHVRPDYVNFCAKGSEDLIMGLSFAYTENLRQVRALLVDGYIEDINDTDENDLVQIAKDSGRYDKEEYDIRYERRYMDALSDFDGITNDSVIDPMATGSIYIGATLASKRRYQKYLKEQNERNMAAAKQGLTTYHLALDVSLATWSMLHEFGHLVESNILDTGRKNTERVYGALSTILLDVKKPKPNQWRNHLINYPAPDDTEIRGKHAGSKLRGRATRHALGPMIQEKLSKYASSSRDELFAEAFVYAHAGPTRKARSEFKPFLQAVKKAK